MRNVFAASVLIISVLSGSFAIAGQKALLIAAGEYPHMPEKFQLSGPKNDVRNMRKFLIEHWAFQSDDVLILEGKTAQKASIIRAISQTLKAEPERPKNQS